MSTRAPPHLKAKCLLGPPLARLPTIPLNTMVTKEVGVLVTGEVVIMGTGEMHIFWSTGVEEPVIATPWVELLTIVMLLELVIIMLLELVIVML